MGREGGTPGTTHGESMVAAAMSEWKAGIAGHPED
jgi:hypothetical protein